MTWKVQKINTQSGAVTMEHPNGYSFGLTIPEDHRGRATESLGFIRDACSGEESSATFISHVAPQPQASLPQSRVNPLLWAAALIPTLALLAWYIARALK